MKKIKITENELITLIERVVNEQATGVAFGGFGENMGFSKPTDKYKDLNIESEGELGESDGGKKGEFGSGKDVYTSEEWDNMSSLDRNLALGVNSGGRPGDYKGIRVTSEEEFNESEIVERLRKRMGPGKFPK